ncbi:hypothetical protein ACIBLA_14260 [Streptomyces sp. NPDC050433]|uniref:hypothetical protein n=1 Tax=Streptomyces sp. NPDC050433 TaxID=3365615 RepID=UPI0037BADE40
MSPEPPVRRSDGAALELLVHGVGGATPQEMLADPYTVRITGDETAAIYRRPADEEAEAHPERYEDGPVAEAYCWSNLTSGNGTRALWLLLLPFMVVNLAHWMRPATNGLARTQRLYGVLVRLLALTLTVLLTAAACEVALDLVAWQCAGSAGCSDERAWLGFLSAARDGWWAQPGRRLALAALVPAALVGLLWYLSNRTWSAYEAQRPPTDLTEATDATDAADANEGPAGTAPDGAPDGAADRAPSVRPALARPGFWYGRRLVARLRAAHTAAGFLTVAGAVTGAAARYDRGAPSAVRESVGWLLQATLVAGGLVVLWVVCSRGRSERRRDGTLDKALISRLPAVSLVLLGIAVVYAAWSRPGWTSSGTLPGSVVFPVLILAQGALVVALAVAALVLHRRAPHARIALYGLGGPAVAMLACALAGVMTGGVAQRVGDWLDGSATPGMGEGSIPGPPVLLSWQAAVIPVLLVLLLVPLVFLVVRTVRTARRLAPLVEAEYGSREENVTPDSIRTRRIAGARARAELTDTAPWLVGLLSGATLLLGVGAVLGAWLSGDVPGRAAEGEPALIQSAADTAQAVGSWLIGLGFILFVTWGRRAYRDPSARRTIGILWDVGTFWPRASHPFAPPCYAERAVPDLTWRMASWTARTGGRLVISGHSQGSVLAAAAVWQLREGTRRQVALLTYGSPLERLYGRWFPAYFGAAPLGDLGREVHCWRNLWRSTDPIGGPVRLGGEGGDGADDGGEPAVDHGPLKDPLAYGRTERHPLPEPILGHSAYQADPAFASERAALLDRLPPALPGQRGGTATDPRSLESGRGQGSSGRSSS